MTTNAPTPDLDTLARGILLSNRLGDVQLALHMTKLAAAQGITATELSARADELLKGE